MSSVIKPVLGSQPQMGHPLMPDNGLWLFNEGIGEKVFDLSGNGNVLSKANHGDGSPFLWIDGGLFTESVGGTKHSYLTTTTPSPNFNIASGQYTIVAQVRPDSFASTYHVLAQFDAYDPMWYIDTDSKLQIYDGGNKTASSSPILTGVKTDIAWVREGTGANETKYYINGVLDSETTHSDSISLPSVINIKGADDGHEWLIKGILYRLYFYNRALTAPEIDLLYREPFCMFERDPIELWVGSVGAGAPPAGIPIFRRRRAG